MVHLTVQIQTLPVIQVSIPEFVIQEVKLSSHHLEQLFESDHKSFHQLQ